MADLHQVIVDDVGQVIGRKTIRFEQHLIINRRVVDHDVATQTIKESSLSGQRHRQPDDVLVTCRESCRDLLFGEIATESIVTGRLALGHPRSPRGFEALCGTETGIGRAFVNEDALQPEQQLTVLDYERASEIMRSASHRAVGVCYCRHKMMHVGRACDAPMDICMTFNASAAALARHGYAREIDVAEGLDLLQQARDRGLVQFGENVQREVNFICNCCGCCCEAMIAARRLGFTNAVQTTNFLPVVDEAVCNGCGKCVNACPVEAMTLVSANDPHHPKLRKASLNPDLCLGCGVCVKTCSRAGLRLEERGERVITPVTSVHRTVLMAIERGMLPNLIFDNQALASHRIMAAILGGILRLPPIQQAMASEQMRSRYLARLLERNEQRFLEN